MHGPMVFIRGARAGIDEGAKLPKGLWKRVARFARPYRTRIAVYLGLLAATSLTTIASPLIFREVIDRAIPQRDMGLLAWFTAAAVALSLVSVALELAGRWLSARIGEGVIFELRTVLFDKIQRMPIAFFTRSQTGALLSRLNSDVVGAQSALTGTLGGVVSNVISLVLTVAVMLKLSWTLTIMSLLLLPAFALPARRVARRMRELTRESMNLNASMNATMTERFNVAGSLLVKLFGSFPAEQTEFAGRAARVRDIGIRQAVYMRVYFAALGLVAATGVTAVYYFGARAVIRGSFTVGTVVAFATYIRQLIGPMQSLVNVRVDLTTAGVSFERVFEIMDIPNPLIEKPDAVPLAAPTGRVTFDDVSFRYPSSGEVTIASLEAGTEASSGSAGEWVLKDVSFEIAPGEMIALVGPSGAGKTTISMLVPRLYDVQQGSVRFDGIDVRDLTLASLTRAIGVVTQDAHLFHDTVRANLLYARPDASEPELIEACRAAQILPFIQSLPDGFDTLVGERGYRLSGGEKQRIAIARVLLKDPALIILDEATAHLDSESESLIQRALAEALSGRSSLVIAHRLSTIIAADTILVVEAGRIVERGRHGALVAAGGLYSELYRTQFSKAAV